MGAIRAEDASYVYDMSVILADIDNDGDRDIYITSLYDKNMLYENFKGKRFRDIADRAGLLFSS